MINSQYISYNYIGEVSSLLITALMLSVIYYSNPRRTFVFKHVLAGLWCSVVSCLLQISILVVCNHPEKYFNRYLFLAQLIAFLIVYNITLFHIFSYVNMMSISRWGQQKQFMMIYGTLSAIYIIGVVLELVSGNIYSMEAGGIDITHFTRFYCCTGIVCALICFAASVSNKADISRIVWTTVCAVVPIDIVLLAGQALVITSTHVVFSGLSYSLVFVLAYLLFHTVVYDEVSGCQGQSAADQYLEKNTGKKQFYVVNVQFVFPTAGTIEDTIHMGSRGIWACRTIEGISKNIRMFMISDEKFIDIIENTDEREARNYINQIRGVFDSVKADIVLPFNYTMIAGRVDERFSSGIEVKQFFDFILRRFTDQDNSHFYMTNDDDIDKFHEFYNISEALKDIRNTWNFDDERVLVYAQPIFSVKSNSFRYAEALMRLKIDDKIIQPNYFIPIAEQTGCIHALSCIILNKVCREVNALSASFDFDAISINISSKELSDPVMYKDLLDIIERNDIDVSKIRMEITETAMFENNDIAGRNMEMLEKEGVQLYLDDFGTGYSSLERVMDCPIKTIKFDKNLLYRSLDDSRMDDILSYMIDVFKKNGFVTLIEGVEDEDQSKYSVERGFELIQGFYFARPQPIDDLKKYFSQKNSY